MNKIALTCKQYESAHSNIALAGMNMKEAQELLDNRFISLEEFFKSKKNFETSSMQIFKSKCEYTINFYKFEQAKGTLLDAFGVNQISAN